MTIKRSVRLNPAGLPEFPNQEVVDLPKAILQLIGEYPPDEGVVFCKEPDSRSRRSVERFFRLQAEGAVVRAVIHYQESRQPYAPGVEDARQIEVPEADLKVRTLVSNVSLFRWKSDAAYPVDYGRLTTGRKHSAIRSAVTLDQVLWTPHVLAIAKLTRASTVDAESLATAPLDPSGARFVAMVREFGYLSK